MEIRNLNIREDSMNLLDARNILLSCIDSAINNYKLKHLGEWEKDNSIKLNDDENYQELVASKEMFKRLLNSYDSNESEVNFNISIDFSLEGRTKDSLKNERLEFNN